MTTENCKEVSKKRENGYRKKINGSLYLFIGERNENQERNGELQERKEQPKWQGLEEKEKLDMKTLVESEGRKKTLEDTSITGEKE